VRVLTTTTTTRAAPHTIGLAELTTHLSTTEGDARDARGRVIDLDIERDIERSRTQATAARRWRRRSW
jgi:hypothetical protein